MVALKHLVIRRSYPPTSLLLLEVVLRGLLCRDTSLSPISSWSTSVPYFVLVDIVLELTCVSAFKDQVVPGLITHSPSYA